jgi:hypothetical protein
MHTLGQTAGNDFALYYVHTHRSRFIPEGVAEASQIFLRNTHDLPNLLSYEE